MKRFGKMLTGIMALGLTAAVPAVAKADHGRYDRYDDHRVERRFEEHRAPIVRERVYVDHRWDRRRVVVTPAPVYVTPAPVYVTPAPVYVGANDCNYGVAIADVPQRVLDVVNIERRGTIESVRFVRDYGREFYSFTLCSPLGGHLEMRVDCGGRLMSVGPC
jgi:PXPV repeat (3 copies)